MTVLYEGACDQPYIAAGGGTPGGQDVRWGFFAQAAASLKGFTGSPWITRGSSSIDNSSPTPVTHFSSHPDGNDYWSGLNYLQAADAGPVWHVLENVATGLQVCLYVEPNGGGGSTTTIIFAPNKFETGGAWRGGGTSVSDRPTDTTSTPTVGRELATIYNPGNFAPANGTGPIFNIVNRLDGTGFYIYHWCTGSPITDSCAIYGVGKIPFPHPSDVSPYFAMWAKETVINQGMYSNDGFSGGYVFRKPDGTLDTLNALWPGNQGNSLFNNNLLDTPDDFIAAYPAFPTALYSTLPFIRGTLPSVFVGAGQGEVADRTTWNTKTFFKLGPVFVPWDGVSTVGGDQPFYEVTPLNTTPSTQGVPDYKRINPGLDQV